jgi:hypothetical protein
MLIYQFSTHSLQSSKSYETETFSWVIASTLEIIVDYMSGRMLTVEGFYPIIQAKKRIIRFPRNVKLDYFFDQRILVGLEKNMVYSLENRFPEYKSIFTIDNLYYDEKHGIIMNGIDDEDLNYYRVSSNVCVAANKEGKLRCLYIKPDQFIK